MIIERQFPVCFSATLGSTSRDALLNFLNALSDIDLLSVVTQRHSRFLLICWRNNLTLRDY